VSNKIIGLVFLALLLLCNSQTASGQASKIDGPRKQLSNVLTAEQVIEDVEYFSRVLQTGHPDLYRYISQAQIDSMLSPIKARAGKLTYAELYNELTRVGVAIGCGHLSISYPKDIERYFYLYSYYPPLHITVHGHDAIIVGEFEHLVGPGFTLVRAIDGVAMDSIITQISRYIYKDGYNATGAIWALRQGWFTDYYNRHMADKESYTYLLEQRTDSGWVLKEVTLPAWDYKNPTYLYSSYVGREKQLDLTFDEETNSAILKIKSFDFYTIKYGRQRFYKFLSDSYKSITERKPAYLILDLRDNTGGSPSYAEAVIRLFNTDVNSMCLTNEIRYRSISDTDKLFSIDYKKDYQRLERRAKPKENGNLVADELGSTYRLKPNTYQGDVFVMVNGGTFSAASELVCYLKANEGATVVGVESGGTCDPITAGVSGEAELPNSKILVHVPLVTFYNDIPLPAEPGRGVIPDIPFRNFGNDKMVDAELVYLLNEIKKKQGNLSGE